MSRDQDVSVMQNADRDALRTHWKLFLFQGVVMLILEHVPPELTR